MSRRSWFLPETPDVHGLLRSQVAVTREGMDELEAWCGGNSDAADRLDAIEHRGDAAKRELLETLRGAFVTDLEPEDIFSLSRGIDWILDYTRDLVREADAMASRPDAVLAEMTALLRNGVADLDEAIRLLGTDGDAAIAASDAAIKDGRAVEHVYYRGMAGLLEVDDRTERIAMRELYRRCNRIAEAIIDVAERITYAVVKQS
jgi:uncharacterized protein